MRYKSTDLKNRILDFVNQYIMDHITAPSLSEIGGAVGLSTSGVYRYLKEMDEEGMLFYHDGKVSTKGTLDYQAGAMTRLNVFDNGVPCGPLTLEEEHLDTQMPVPIRLFGDGELFMLHANGDSMIGAGIEDGDRIVIRKQPDAHPGDIIAALVDNETTLKRYMLDRDRRPYLHSENPKYEDIYPPVLTIQGVATHIIKKLDA